MFVQSGLFAMACTYDNGETEYPTHKPERVTSLHYEDKRENGKKCQNYGS